METKPVLRYKKLTDWKNEPSVDDLKNDFILAQNSHDSQQAKITEWEDAINVTGKARPPKIKGRSRVQPMLIRRQAEWRYSALSEPFLNSHKIFQVNPRTFEDVDSAKQNELLLNYQFDTKLNKVKLIDDIVRTTCNKGTCALRTGWIRTSHMETKQVPIYGYYPTQDMSYLQSLQQAVELRNSNPRGYDEQVSDEMKASVDYFLETNIPSLVQVEGYQEVQEEVIEENKPTVEVVNINNLYIDPTCNGDIDKALFVIYSFETNKAELVKSGMYKNLDLVNWDTNSPLSDGEHEPVNQDDYRFKDVARRKVVAYEYWGFYDIEGNDTLVPFVATWIGDIMIRMELNPFPDNKIPFVLIPYLPIPGSVYGEPDAALLMDNQKIIGALTRGMIDLLGRSANGQQGFAKGMLDYVNEKRFKNGEDYEFNPTFNPVNSYIEHKYPEIPASAITMLQLQNQEAEALTGVKSFYGGVSGDSYGQVVAGIKGALDASSKREMAILRRIAKGVCEVGEKIIAMNAEFLSEQEIVRVTNKQFIPINREDLKGNFDLQVDINTAEIDNEKAQDLGFMLQTLGPNLDPVLAMTILADIADLKRMPGLAEKLRAWRPQPDPLAEQMKQLEVQEKAMEVEKLKSEIALNQMKMQETQAKAEGLAIDNQQELSGTKHMQEMEKQQAQARANQSLEVTKALVKSKKEGERDPDIASAIGYNALSQQLNNL